MSRLGLRNRSIDQLVSKDLLNELSGNVRKNCRQFESIVDRNGRKQTTRSGHQNHRNRKTSMNRSEVMDRSYMVYEGIHNHIIDGIRVNKRDITNEEFINDNIMIDPIIGQINENKVIDKPVNESKVINNKPFVAKPPLNDNLRQNLSQRSKERKVPANRVSRMASFGSLAVGLGFGALEEITKKTLGFSSERSSIFERVRQSADFMPVRQMRKVLREELGDDWESKFKSFDDKPFAAASIGQVHRATLPDGLEVAVKIQYPGVADGIESDIKNMLSVLRFGNILPEGLFVENIMRYARKELSWEVDYNREALCQHKYRQLLSTRLNNKGLYVPKVIDQLSTKRVFTSELISGIPVDRLEKMDSIPQELKNRIAKQLLDLTLREVFEFGFMQTDPNWSNFFYDIDSDMISLLDFGSSREYSKEFVNSYMDVIRAAADQDRDRVVETSKKIGFLTGYENQIFERTHTNAIMILGEAFAANGLFDFGDQKTTIA
ncbi:unnamed protein product [Medioppia subpectinata]|uniref:ABC1 atypical kinase-like domain-containing protein n=1 Tax=Medioppia subpectinata TaxID=1979941 RepID=A0A7R9PZ34_9ACAR|nr:unnamed protein product [Medioppia subpectinata]CAG2106507.1 unnamed protein product [Medioppia subpectinata]